MRRSDCGFSGKHALIDTLAISAGALFFPKYFRDRVESDSFEEHFQAVKVTVPPLEAEQEYPLTAETKVGLLDSAVKLAQWKGKDYPTIIYHHGASEIPYDYGFGNIFPIEKESIEANLLLVCAPYHGNRKSFMSGMAATENWLALMAVSIHVIEQIIEQFRVKTAAPIVVSGTSLGGFITNLHHIHYNSADRYAPLLAGTAMHEAFLNSVYSKAVAPKAKEQPELMTQLFNFEDVFKNRDHGNVFPLLGKFDAIIRFDVQKASYGGLEVAVIEKGHTTGALAYRELREHILSTLEK
jgi:hypothetical protein